MGRSLLLIAIAAVALVAQHPSGGGNAGGGTGSPPYQASFSAVTTLTVTAATHGKGTQPYVDGCWDNATPRNAIALSANYPTVAANGDVVVAWTGSKTGYCLIASGSASGSAGGDLTGTYPAPAIAAGAVTTAKIGDGQVTAAKIAAGDKTGAGSKIVTAGSTPADGCATFASGNLGSTGLVCGGGGGGAVSSVYGRTGAVTAQSGDYSAGQVANTPAGAIAATTVQAALNELDTEKQAALGFTPENSANRGAANGYAPLDSGSRVPAASLGSGTANGSTFLAGDQTYKSVTGQVQVQNDAVNVGSPRGTIDMTSSTGLTFNIADTGSKVTIQPLIDSATWASIAAIQTGDVDSATCTGTNAYQCNPAKPFPSATPSTGATGKWKFTNASTGAVTIAVSAGGNAKKALKIDRTTQLGNGDLAAGSVHTFVYDSAADSAAGAWIQQSGATGGSSAAPVFDTFANRPAEPCTIGTLFYASDITGKHWVCGTGNTWKAVAFGMLITEPPAAASWTTVVSSGGGSPTVTDVGGAIRYVGGSSGGSAIVRAVPGSTPYSVVFAYTSAQSELNGNFLTLCGLVLTNGTGTSADRMIIGWFDQSNTGNSSDHRIYINYYNNVATYFGQLTKRTTIYPGTPPLLRYRDDGTNRYVDLWDGSGWNNALSESRTAFLTATHYGFTCDSNKASATLYHWKP